MSHAEDFQTASQEAVALLTGVTNSLERNDYLYKIADRLAAGKGMLAVQIEEELRKRVRSRRWTAPQAKPNKEDPTQRLYVAEFQLLQIFLNIPEYRADIVRALEEDELEFSFPVHRQVWDVIAELQDDYPEHLISHLQNRVAEDATLSDYVYSLLWISEMNRVSLLRPSLVMRAALANIALEICQKRHLHWMRYWEKAFTEGHREEAQHYYEQIQQEHQRIQDLKSRCRLTLEQMTTLEEAMIPQEEAF